MKKKYEIYLGLYVFSFLFLLFFIGCCCYFNQITYKNYYATNATVVSKSSLQFLLDSKMLEQLMKNKTLFIQGETYPIEVEEVIRNILKRKKRNYHQVKVHIQWKNSYSLFDVIPIEIYRKKEKVWKIFKTCWKGGKDERINE